MSDLTAAIHPLALAYLQAYAAAHGSGEVPLGGAGGAPMAMHRAQAVWRSAGCPILRRQLPNGDDFKQWGSWAPSSLPWDVDEESVARPSGIPAWRDPPTGGNMAMMCVGKVAAGRLLDGRTWDEIPAGVSHA